MNKLTKEALDPVGKEDGDVNNDGKKDSSDKYLMKRRKAIATAMASTKKKVKEEVEAVAEGDGDPCWDSHKQVGMKKKGGKMVPNCVPKTRTESFSSWRNDLSEVMIDDDNNDKPIKEKKVTNKIKINPKLGEAIEEMGGELIEATEVDEAVYGGTPPEKKDTRMVVTNADKKANTPAYQKMKAGDKRYKSADHMDEEKKPLPKNKMFRKAGNLGRDGSPEAMERSKKITKTLNKANEEVEVDEAMMAGPRKDAMKKKEYSAKSGSDRATAFNIGTRRDVSVSDPKIKSRGGRTDKRTGEGDRGMGNAAKRRMKEDASMSPQETALQKKKLMVDVAIAKRRKQDLSKKTDTPTKVMGEDSDPCWDTHKQVGMKKKGNRMVPNCVPKGVKEETEDSLKDRRMERGGVDGNTRYDRAPKPVNTAGKKKPYDGMSALEKVKASIRAKYGQGAIMDTKKK